MKNLRLLEILSVFLFFLGISMCLWAYSQTAFALSVYQTVQGGIGTSSPSGILYGDNGSSGHLNTVTIGPGCSFIAGVLSCTAATGSVTSLSANYPISVSAATGAVTISTVATSSLGLTVSSFASHNISQWTNDAGYITSGGGSGTVATSTQDTSGYLTFFTSTNQTPARIGGDAGLFWDNVKKFLGIGTTTPTASVSIQATVNNAPLNIASSSGATVLSVNGNDDLAVYPTGNSKYGGFLVDYNTASTTFPNVVHRDSITLVGADNDFPAYYAYSFHFRSIWESYFADGTQASSTNAKAGSEISRFAMRAYGASGYTGSIAALSGFAAQDISDTAQGAWIGIRTTALNTVGGGSQAIPPVTSAFTAAGGLIVGSSHFTYSPSNFAFYDTDPGNGNIVATGITTSGATTSTQYVTGLATPAGSFLAIDSLGKVIATSSPLAGLSSYDAFTHTTYFGQPVSATTTALQLNGFPNSIFASSTAQFDVLNVASSTATSTFAGSVAFGTSTSQPYIKYSPAAVVVVGNNNTLTALDGITIGSARNASQDINIYEGSGGGAGGRLTISNGQGIAFQPRGSGPDYGTNIGGLQYRTATEGFTTVGNFFLYRGGGYVFENENAVWMASLTPTGLNIGNSNTALIPVNRLEVTGNEAVGTDYADLFAAPTNGLLVEGNTGIGTTSPFVRLNVAAAGGVTNFGQLALTDTNAPTNAHHWLLTSEGGNFYIGTTSDLYATSTIASIGILPGSASSTGSVGINQTPNPRQGLVVSFTNSLTGAGQTLGATIGNTYIGNSPNTPIFGLNASATFNGTVNDTQASTAGGAVGGSYQANNAASSSIATLLKMSAVNATCGENGNMTFSTTTTCVGFNASAPSLSTGNSLYNYFAFQAVAGITGAGTVGKYVGVNIPSATSGTTSNAEILLGATQGPSSGNYAIDQVDTAQDYLNGSYTHLGNTAPNNLSCVNTTAACGELWGNDNTISGVQFGVGNTNGGTSAYSGYYLNNSLASDGLTDHYGFLGFNSPTYSDSTFGTTFATPNQLYLQNTDGIISLVSSTSTTNGGITFVTGGSAASNERMRIASTGNVGIGTTTPFAKLSIAGTSGGTIPLLMVSTSTSGFATSTALTVDLNGKVGVATSSPWTAFAVNGTVAFNNLSIVGSSSDFPVCIAPSGLVVNSGSTTCTLSSRFIKHSIEDVAADTAAADIENLRPVTYVENASGEHLYGFVAEEVAKTDPLLAEYASQDETIDGHDFKKGDPLSVDYPRMTAVIVKYLQNHALGSAPVRSAEEDWQWGILGLCLIGLVYQQFQIKRLKK